MFRLQNVKLCAAALLTAFAMTGCSIGINVDTMLTPPKLSAQQEQIYQALKDSTGSDIRLKYPKRGDYLSAFIVADIDGDNAEEAIVFYEKNSISGLRINVLDCIDGEWRSIHDRNAEGSEIEKVVLSPLGELDRMNVIVGYSTSNQSEKYIAVYTYEDGYLNQTFERSYTMFDVADTGGGAPHPDLILLGAATASDPFAYATVYRLQEADRSYHRYDYSFKDSYTDFSQIIYSTKSDGSVVMYIDAATGTANLQTEILLLDTTGISNMLERCKRPSGDIARSEDTVRRAGLSCTDIDSDGVPEIPVQEVFLGYKDAAESEQIRETKWLMMKEPQFYAEYHSYYNAGDGYAFLLPESWENRVSVVRDTLEDELQFVVYNGAWEEDMPVLMHIYIAYDDADREEHLNNGYELLHTKGTASCLVKAEEGHELSLTLGKLLPCFRFLN